MKNIIIVIVFVLRIIVGTFLQSIQEVLIDGYYICIVLKVQREIQYQVTDDGFTI